MPDLMSDLANHSIGGTPLGTVPPIGTDSMDMPAIVVAPVVAPPAAPSTTLSIPSDASGVTRRLDLACALLADERVRSVTIDRKASEATVCYRDHSQVREPLAMLAAQVRTDQASLQSVRVISPDEVICWSDEKQERDAYVCSPQEATGWRRAMHLALAFTWFSLAMIGVVLPGMPTTVFLLMTSYSLARSSHRLHRRLLDSKWFGPSLRDWRLYRGVRKGVKTKALTIMAVVVGATVLLSGLPVKALLGIVGGASIGVICVARLRVIEE